MLAVCQQYNNKNYSVYELHSMQTPATQYKKSSSKQTNHAKGLMKTWFWLHILEKVENILKCSIS